MSSNSAVFLAATMDSVDGRRDRLIVVVCESRCPTHTWQQDDGYMSCPNFLVIRRSFSVNSCVNLPALTDSYNRAQPRSEGYMWGETQAFPSAFLHES